MNVFYFTFYADYFFECNDKAYLCRSLRESPFILADKKQVNRNVNICDGGRFTHFYSKSHRFADQLRLFPLEMNAAITR